MARAPYNPIPAAIDVRQHRKKLTDFPKEHRAAIAGVMRKDGTLLQHIRKGQVPTDRFSNKQPATRYTVT